MGVFKCTGPWIALPKLNLVSFLSWVDNPFARLAGASPGFLASGEVVKTGEGGVWPLAHTVVAMSQLGTSELEEGCCRLVLGG